MPDGRSPEGTIQSAFQEILRPDKIRTLNDEREECGGLRLGCGSPRSIHCAMGKPCKTGEAIRKTIYFQNV